MEIGWLADTPRVPPMLKAPMPEEFSVPCRLVRLVVKEFSVMVALPVCAVSVTEVGSVTE